MAAENEKEEPIIPTDATETPAVVEAPAASDTSAAAEQPAIPTETVAATPTPPSLSGLREFVKSKYNLDTSGWQDDNTLAEALMRNAMEAQQRAQEAEHYRRMAAEYERRYQQPAPKVEEKPKSLLARKPQFDQAWETMIEKDPVTGDLKAKPGYSPSVVRDYQDAMGWQQQFAREWVTNPEKVIQELIPQHVEKLVAEKIAAYQTQQQATQIIDRHANWFYVGDGKGNYTRQPSGERIISQTGRRYLEIVNQVAQDGISDPAKQDYYACLQLSRESAAQPQQQAEPPKPAAPVVKANPAAAARAPSATNGTTKQVSTNGLSLHAKLSRDMAAAGYGADTMLKIGDDVSQGGE